MWSAIFGKGRDCVEQTIRRTEKTKFFGLCKKNLRQEKTSRAKVANPKTSRKQKNNQHIEPAKT